MVSTFSVFVAILPVGVTVPEREVHVEPARSVNADTWYVPPSTAFQESVTVFPETDTGLEVQVSKVFVDPL